MANIRVTPEVLEQQGTALVAFSEELGQTLENVKSKVNEIVEGWDGLAQDSYFAMYEEMQTSLKEFPNLVNSLGEATKSAAKAFSELDTSLQSSFSGN